MYQNIRKMEHKRWGRLLNARFDNEKSEKNIYRLTLVESSANEIIQKEMVVHNYLITGYKNYS